MTERFRAGGWTVVLGLAVLLAACRPEGETAEWWLADSSPDGRVLELVTLGGGCSAFAGWVSEADADRVLVEAHWEHIEAANCRAALRAITLVVDLDEPLGDRALLGCGHDDCLALPAEGDEHSTSPARIEPGGPGAVVSGREDVWGVAPDGTIAWQAPLDDGWIGSVDARDVPDERLDAGGSQAADAYTSRLEFDGEGSWLEVYETATGEQRHRIRLADPEAAIGPPMRLDDARVVLGQQQPDRLWVVELAEGHIRELTAAAGRVHGVVDGVVFVGGETPTRAIDVDGDARLWEPPRARGGERVVIGDGALVVFDRDVGSITLLDPRRGDVSWTADLGTPPGVDVAAVGDRLLVTTSTTLFTFDAATGEPHGWTALVPERAETVGGTHPPHRVTNR